MIQRALFLFFLTFAALHFSAAFAQSMGVVLINNAAVHEQPTVKSETLVELEKGKKVSVLDHKPGWLKVKVQLDRSFSFTGWVNDKSIALKKLVAKPVAKAVVPVATPIPVAPIRPTISIPTPVPTAVPTAAPKTNLDQFFAPAAPASPTESKGSFSPQTKIEKQEAMKKVIRLKEKARVSLGVGYLLYHYDLKTGGATPTQLFAYNLPGLGIDLNATYWYWEHSGQKLRAGANVFFQYGLYKYGTNLQDKDGLTFQAVDSSSSSLNGIVTFPLDYRFEIFDFPLNVGVDAGVQYFHFSADDVKNDAGKLNLFVSQTMTSVLGGAYASFFPGSFHHTLVTFGFDVIPMSFVSESPKNATGTSPSGSFGLAPHLSVDWVLSERHRLGIGYKLRMQDIQFKGTGSRVGTSNVTSGKASTALHDFQLAYEYHF